MEDLARSRLFLWHNWETLVYILLACNNLFGPVCYSVFPTPRRSLQYSLMSLKDKKQSLAGGEEDGSSHIRISSNSPFRGPDSQSISYLYGSSEHNLSATLKLSQEWSKPLLHRRRQMFFLSAPQQCWHNIPLNRREVLSSQSGLSKMNSYPHVLTYVCNTSCCST